MSKYTIILILVLVAAIIGTQVYEVLDWYSGIGLLVLAVITFYLINKVMTDE